MCNSARFGCWARSCQRDLLKKVTPFSVGTRCLSRIGTNRTSRVIRFWYVGRDVFTSAGCTGRCPRHERHSTGADRRLNKYISDPVVMVSVQEAPTLV